MLLGYSCCETRARTCGAWRYLFLLSPFSFALSGVSREQTPGCDRSTSAPQLHTICLMFAVGHVAKLASFQQNSQSVDPAATRQCRVATRRVLMTAQRFDHRHYFNLTDRIGRIGRTSSFSNSIGKGTRIIFRLVFP